MRLREPRAWVSVGGGRRGRAGAGGAARKGGLGGSGEGVQGNNLRKGQVRGQGAGVCRGAAAARAKLCHHLAPVLHIAGQRHPRLMGIVGARGRRLRLNPKHLSQLRQLLQGGRGEDGSGGGRRNDRRAASHVQQGARGAGRVQHALQGLRAAVLRRKAHPHSLPRARGLRQQGRAVLRGEARKAPLRVLIAQRRPQRRKGGGGREVQEKGVGGEEPQQGALQGGQDGLERRGGLGGGGGVARRVGSHKGAASEGVGLERASEKDQRWWGGGRCRIRRPPRSASQQQERETQHLSQCKCEIAEGAAESREGRLDRCTCNPSGSAESGRVAA